MNSLLTNIFLVDKKKISIFLSGIIIFLVILDLLATHQILYFDNKGEIVLFTLTVFVGYGGGSWILLEYVRKTTASLRSKSHLLNTMHWSVTIIQLSLFAILIFILYNNSLNCYQYFSKCTNDRIETTLVYVMSSITAIIVMGIFSFKFFTWYSLNKRNFMILFYGLAAATFTIAITEDLYTEIIFIYVIEEKSSPNINPQTSFIYKTVGKYHGEIQYKAVNPNTAAIWVLPSSIVPLKTNLDYLGALPYIFTWLAVATLLRKYYKSIRPGKFPLKFWGILFIPLILYLIGSGLIISLPADILSKFYFRLVLRAGTIGSSVLFSLAFYISTRNLSIIKVKDYLVISAMGIIPIGIAFEVSSLQQTFGIAAHSLVLLSSYLFTVGLYSLAISISQDTSLKKSIRSSTMDVIKLLDIGGTAQIRQEIEKRVLNIAKEQHSILQKQSGIEPSLTENDMKQYLATILKEIKVLRNIDEILKKGKEILESSYEFLVCSRISGLHLVYNNYFSLYKKIMNKYEKAEHKGIKLVTTIVDQDSADLVKKFQDIGVQIRHVNNMPPIDFALSDKEIIATIDKSKEPEERIKSLLVSNEQAHVSHYAFIFHELWRDATDAKERVLAIEQGIEPQFLDVITDREKARYVFLDLAKSIKKEALLLLPNDKALIRIDKIGIIDHLIRSSQENGAIIKIICTMSKENSTIFEKIYKNAPNIQVLNGNISSAGMFIVDNEKFFRAELKDPQADEFMESIGFPIYSNSKLSVQSFRSIFDLLWNERVLNEKLKNIDNMQKEFIGIAAHELRNPIQPIMGLTKILQSQIKDADQKQLLDAIYRNAKKLKQLTDVVLDLTRIESNTLQLTSEKFNLEDIILNTINEFKSSLKNEGKEDKINLNFISKEKENTYFVYGDIQRIAQVISNILNNAIKFTEEGSITTMIKKNGDGLTANNNNHKFAVVTIKDTGKGIDASIKDKLFEKFETKSDIGIGLGLYISKKIIEAHGGRIWAQNNNDGKGATFSFSLPIIN